MKTQFAVTMVFLYACSSLSLADIYVGSGLVYQVINIDQVDSLSTVPNARFEPPLSLVDEELPDLYSDEFTGINFVLGYSIGSSLSFEISYFNSLSEKHEESTEIGIIDTAYAEIDVESLSFDILGHYHFSGSNSVSMLGSLGLIYQETKVTREYQVIILCLIDTDSECNGRRKERANENAYDTRLQLGAGIQYDVSDRLGLRTIVKVVPDGFSIGEDFPYAISAGLLYSF